MERASLAPALNNQGPLKRHYAFHAFVISTAQNNCISDLSGAEKAVFGFARFFFLFQQRLVRGECSGGKEGGNLEAQLDVPQERKEGVMSQQGCAVYSYLVPSHRISIIAQRTDIH